MKKKKDKEIKGTFVVLSSTMQTPNQIVRGVFGMSLEELVQEIVENRDGKYDSLYEKKSS